MQPPSPARKAALVVALQAARDGKVATEAPEDGETGAAHKNESTEEPKVAAQQQVATPPLLASPSDATGGSKASTHSNVRALAIAAAASSLSTVLCVNKHCNLLQPFPGLCNMWTLQHMERSVARGTFCCCRQCFQRMCKMIKYGIHRKGVSCRVHHFGCISTMSHDALDVCCLRVAVVNRFEAVELLYRLFWHN